MAQVDYFQNACDMEAALLGALGFSTDYIRERTGLTHCQVLYRLGKASIKRVDYRNGGSVVAREVVGQVSAAAKRIIGPRLRKAMKLELESGKKLRLRA